MQVELDIDFRKALNMLEAFKHCWVQIERWAQYSYNTDIADAKQGQEQ